LKSRNAQYTGIKHLSLWERSKRTAFRVRVEAAADSYAADGSWIRRLSLRERSKRVALRVKAEF